MKYSMSNNKGAVLVIGLITLVVLSLLVVNSMQGSTMEVKMAGNSKDEVIALQAAEMALIAGEELIDSGVLSLTDFQTNNADGLYENDSNTIWEDINWASQSISTGYSHSTITSSPRFVIQHMGETGEDDGVGGESYVDTTVSSGVGTVQLFKITARGTGSSDNSVVFLQSVYGAEW